MKLSDEYAGLVALESSYDMILLNIERAMAHVTVIDELEAEYNHILEKIRDVREQMEIFYIIDFCNTSNWKWIP